jgi:hypothetical protein
LIGFLHAHRHVRLQFFEEPLAQFARRAPRAFLAAHGAGVHAERHAHGGFFHANGRQRFRLERIGDGFADEDFRQAGQGDDLACFPPSLRAFRLDGRRLAISGVNRPVDGDADYFLCPPDVSGKQASVAMRPLWSS